jgi:hypothetical protein
MEVIRMRTTYEPGELHGWDDGRIFFWDEERKKDRCVTDEEELYQQLVEICREYFRKKDSRGDEIK